MIKVGINGFGRIGRMVFRAAAQRDDLQVVAINDLLDADYLAYMLKYDSVHGRFKGDVGVKDGKLVVNGKEIRVTAETDPTKLNWGAVGVDVVVESTGIFLTKEGAEGHIKAGAKKVVITAPAKGEDITLVLGVNDDQYDPDKHHIISNASCTTNCLAPVAFILHKKYGIKRGLMSTIHSYTNDQRILDLAHKDLRRARAAAINIIPTSTGAAQAVALVIPELEGKFDGMSFRVPTPTVSVVDFVAELERDVTVEELNEAFREAGQTDGWLGKVFGATDEPLVSSDFIGDARSAVVDLLSTQVVGGNLVKVVAWYDNEWGYSNRVADLCYFIAEKGLVGQQQAVATDQSAD